MGRGSKKKVSLGDVFHRAGDLPRGCRFRIHRGGKPLSRRLWTGTEVPEVLETALTYSGSPVYSQGVHPCYMMPYTRVKGATDTFVVVDIATD